MKRLKPIPAEPFAQLWNDWEDEQRTVTVVFETWDYYVESYVSQFPGLGTEKKPNTDPEGERYYRADRRWIDSAALQNPGIHKNEIDDEQTEYHVITRSEELTLPLCQKRIQDIYHEYGEALQLVY
jgi:hypothetical protein